MLYDLEQSRTEDFIIKRCARDGVKLPDAIANAPILFEGNVFFYLAFVELINSRNISAMGEMLPISWHVLNEYCRINEIDGNFRETFMFLIKELDLAYIENRKEKAGQ